MTPWVVALEVRIIAGPRGRNIPEGAGIPNPEGASPLLTDYAKPASGLTTQWITSTLGVTNGENYPKSFPKIEVLKLWESSFQTILRLTRCNTWGHRPAFNKLVRANLRPSAEVP